MGNSKLPPNVFQLPQGRLKAISGSPWVYWINDAIRALFTNLPKLDELAEPRQGLATADNFRFLRYWWEIGFGQIKFDSENQEFAKNSPKRWFPHMKGGQYKKWYGNQDYVINFKNDGYELKAWAAPLYGNSGWSRIIKSVDRYFSEGITFTDLTSGGLSMRWMPRGFIFDHSGNCLFPRHGDLFSWLAFLNSNAFSSLMQVNPTIHFYIGDFRKMPVPLEIIKHQKLSQLGQMATKIQQLFSKFSENTFDFVIPPDSQESLNGLNEKLKSIEDEIDEICYTAYGFSSEFHQTIESNNSMIIEDEDGRITSDGTAEEDLEVLQFSKRSLAIQWISYAIGLVLSCFELGKGENIGSGFFNEIDKFLLGSGYPNSFSSRIDKKNINRVAELSISEGIAVFDQHHSSDLSSRVWKVLELLRGEEGAKIVIENGAGGDLRKFLEKDYFTTYHLKWYRKRPVYWYIQSSKRSYGFVIFHEKITKDTFYAIQREPYLDTKRNAVTLEMQDVQARIKQSAGGERKKLEKRLAELHDLADELAQFAKDLEEITRNGYEPEPDWIDDGVILRMAPLWKVIPLWKSEPKKYWERLEAGDFDWSHIAMRYWPQRVREKCKKNKSYAIAHGHEEWYEG